MASLLFLSFFRILVSTVCLSWFSQLLDCLRTILESVIEITIKNY